MAIDPNGTDLSGADLGGMLTADAVKRMFDQYGMSDLWSVVEGLVSQWGEQGADPDTVLLTIRDTDAYKKRFAANEERIRKGLPELTPAQYIQLEQQYRMIMDQSGLPSGFYRDRKDYEKWIADDNSPYEIQARINTAAQATANADPAIKQALRDYYGVDDAGIMAHFLDPKTAADTLTSQYGAAQVGGAYRSQGLDMGRSLAEEISMSPSNVANAAAGASQVAADLSRAGQLGAIWGEDLTSEDLTRDTFNLAGGSEARRKKGKLASQERAAFSGASATASGSLGSSSTAGQL